MGGTDAPACGFGQGKQGKFMSIEISAPAPTPTSSTAVKPGARASNTQATGDTPAVSFLSMLSALGLGAVDAGAGAAMGALPQMLSARAEPVIEGRQATEAGQDDAAALAAFLPADWWPTTAPDAAATLAGQARAGAHGTGAALAGAQALQAKQLAAKEAASSQPATRLSATSELQQLPAQALQAVQQDGDATPLSSRDFMARVEAARVAAEPDAAAMRSSSTPMAGAPSTVQTSSLFDAAAAGLHAGGALRSQERLQARTAGTASVQGLVTWGDATPVGTQHGASAVYAPGAMTPAPATAMAEKVHYWVSRGVQSAELQLDAFAGGSVDVSIAVKGDEAVIEFRTDQPQARQLLADAMPQLKELLAGEGLMLSGGFVGTSAQQGGQSQGQSAPQSSATREPVATAPQTVQGRSVVVDGASGGRVDLFV
jgi:flagellar hook-length control protein FliK